MVKRKKSTAEAADDDDQKLYLAYQDTFVSLQKPPPVPQGGGGLIALSYWEQYCAAHPPVPGPYVRGVIWS